VIVSDGAIDYPCAERADVLLALTQEAYDRYAGEVAPGALVVVDADRVAPGPADGGACHALPITATATRVLGGGVGANLVALGALVALSGVVEHAALERAVAARRPGGSAERALLAVRAGAGLVAGGSA